MGRGRPAAVFDAAEAVSMYEAGASIDAVARRFGTAKKTVREAMVAAGAAIRPSSRTGGKRKVVGRMGRRPAMTPDQVVKAALAVSRGETVASVALSMGLTPRTVARAVRSAGVAPRTGRPKKRTKDEAATVIDILVGRLGGESEVEIAGGLGISPERVAEVVRKATKGAWLAAEYAAGRDPAEIVERHGVSRQRLHQARKRWGVDVEESRAHGRIASSEWIDEAARLYAEGCPSDALAERYGCSAPSLRKAIAERGVKVATKGGSRDAESYARELAVLSRHISGMHPLRIAAETGLHEFTVGCMVERAPKTALLAAEYAVGTPISDIARAYGATPKTITCARVRYGVPPRRPRDGSVRNGVERLHREGVPRSEIARRFKTSLGYVAGILGPVGSPCRTA